MSSSAETLANPRGKKVATIEFWRFAFTVLVVIYHLEVNFAQRSLLLSGASAVEFFFIISGFLMAKSAYGFTQRHTEPVSVREAHHLALDFVKKKLIAIYPILIVVMLFWAVGVITAEPPEPVSFDWGNWGGTGGGFDWGGGTGTGGGFDWGGGTGTGGGFDWGGGGTGAGGGFDWGSFDWSTWGQPEPVSPVVEKLKTLMNTEYTWLMLIGTPPGFMSLTEAIPLWFLTCLLVIGYLYTFAINKRYDIMAFLAPALGVICWLYFTLTVSPFTGILDSSTKAGFLNTGMVKAISEMSFGVCLFMLYNYLTEKNLSRFWRVILSILEIYAVIRFCMLTFNQSIGNQNYVRLLYLMIIVLCAFLNVTLLARLLDRNIFRWLGKISLAMYISHYFLKNFYVSFFMKTDAIFLPGKLAVKDAILYPLVVIAASVLIMLYIEFIKRFIIRPLRQRREWDAAERAALAAEVTEQ